MIYLTNPRFLTLWKSLRLEVADSGLAQVDTTWNMVNVCSPYSRLYFISHGGGILTLRGREIPLKEGCAYLIPAGLLYNYRCDASMEQLYFHVNITQVNGMDLFYGCDTVYEHDAPAEDLEKVLALYRSQRMEDAFLLQGLLWEELGRFIQMADLQEEQTKIYSGMVSVSYTHLIFVTALAYIYMKYRKMSLLQGILGSLRPAVVSLIAIAGVTILISAVFTNGAVEFRTDNVSIRAIIWFIIAVILLRKKKMDPILVMVLCGVFETVCTLVMKWI